MIGPNSLLEIFKVMPSPGMVLLPVAPDFTIVAVNDAYLLLNHHTREYLIGKPLAEAFSNHPDLLIEGWEVSMQKVLSNKMPVNLPARKYLGPSKNGLLKKTRHIDVTMTPVLNEHNVVEHILFTIAEVRPAESRKRNKDTAVEKLLKNERLLNEVQHLARIGAWEIDLCKKTITWSDVQREIHEVDQDCELGLAAVAGFYTQNKKRALITYLVEEAISNNNMFDVELFVKTAKGSERLVRSIGKGVFEGDKCIRLYGISQDITDHKNLVLAHASTRNKFQSLLKRVGAVVWEAKASTFEVTYISEHVRFILGYTPEEWRAELHFWENHLHPDDREFVLNYCRAQTKTAKNYTLDYRMIRADGKQVWIKDIVTVITENGKPQMLHGLMVDITETKRLNELEFLEKKILELNGKKGIAAQEVLTAYLEGIELIYPKMQCAILQVKNNKLYKWAAPSLPKLYMAAIEGLPISKSVGCSGAAAFLKHEIIITDIKNDPRWAKHRKVALKANISACWSYPIITTENEVIATFGIYYNEPAAPDKEELKVIERTINVLKMILENRRTMEILKETNMLMKECQEMARFGIWSWDVVNNTVNWSDPLFNIFGLNKRRFRPTFEAYLDLLHPDDKERISVNMGGVLSTKKEVKFEERIVRPDGEIRYLKSCAKLILDENGTPAKLIGASVDITESKKIQEKRLAGGSRLKSLMESQTNYVLRIDFQGKFTYCNDKFLSDFGWIYNGENLIGLDAIKIVSPHQYQEFFNLAENCINHPNKVYEAEVETTDKNGCPKVSLWQIVCLTDEKGLPFQMQCIGMDFTWHTQAKDAIKRKYERYHYVNLANNEAIYDWDIIADHVNWGEGYHKLFGYQLFGGRYPMVRWLSKLHPEDRDVVERCFADVVADQTKYNWSSNYQYKRSDGSYAHVEENAYFVRDENGKAIRMIGAMRDITAQMKTAAEMKTLQHELEDHLKILSVFNAELTDSSKNYQDLFYMSPQPMWIYEATTLKFLDVNDAAVRFYGYNRMEFLMMDGTMLMPKEEISKNLDGSAPTFMGQEIFFHGVYRHAKKNGEIMHMDVQTKKMKFQGRDTYLVLANDITERIKYLETVEKQNQKLQEISWIQSHVVRAPLARITHLIESIEAKACSDRDKTQLDNLLLNAADELEGLLNKIAKKA
jgi:PAS domain S-box-containing protein